MGAHMHWIYSLLLGAALIVAAPWWLFGMLRRGKYRAGLAQRLGRVPAHLREPEPEGCIWIHAVSVGEVLAALALVEHLRRRFPARRVVLSTTTATGQRLARERAGEQNVFYFPLDFALAIRPFLRALRPALVVIAETEFWPNFLRLAKKSGARVAVVNARISDRSLPRYRRTRLLLRHALRNVDVFLAQSEEDARRLRAIGAPAERVRVSGNLKFDVRPPGAAPLLEQVRAAVGAGSGGEARPVIVCGSTVEGEEPLLLRALEIVLARRPDAAILLAPRHPERFDQVAALLARSGLAFVRRTQWQGEPLAGKVLLLDSIGELAAVYGAASIAFVGGSLVARGGHNILEPAHYGVPIVVGPHTENFRDIVTLFRRAGAVRVAAAADLAGVLLELLTDRAACAAMGAAAARVLQEQSGATERTLQALAELLPPRPERRSGVREAAP
jgi:3-deoxy-D-manno-octulosonic-acid transferase